MAAPRQPGLAFSLFGIPVLIRPAFLIIPVIGAMTFQRANQEPDWPKIGTWVALVFVSVLIHELGHALAMKAFRFAPTIELVALGGLTHWPQGARPVASQRFVVTFAGPLAGLAFGVGFLLFGALDKRLAADGTLAFLVEQGTWVNIAWSLINLAPVLPWDGGAIVDAGLELVTGKPRPRIVGGLSVVFAVGVLAVAVWMKAWILGYFALMGFTAGWRRFQSSAQAESAEKAWALVLAGKPGEGEQVALARLRTAADPAERARLIEIVAWARLHLKDVKGAKDAVAALQDFTPSVELSARIAAADNDAQKVVSLLDPLVASRQIPASAAPLLVSALLALEQPARVVQLCRALSEPGRATDRAFQTAVHDASAKLFQAGAYQASYEVCVLGFERFGSAVFGFNAACCQSKLGRLDDALAWVARAVDAGYLEVEVLEKDEDIAPVRALPGFATVLERARARAAPHALPATAEK